MRVRRALRIATTLAIALGARPLLAKDGPTFHTTKVEHYPYNLNYFEDSDVVLFQDDTKGTLYRSEDAGASWNQVTAIPDGKVLQLVMHEYDPNRAYVLTPGISHFRTSDRGKTWQTFLVDTEMSIFRNEILNFHAGNPDRIIFNGMDCQGIFCDEVSMYTVDGFASDAKLLRGSTSGCWWAKSSTLFSTGRDDLDDQRILCLVRDEFSPLKQDQRLLISDNYFSATSADGQIQEYEPDLDMNRAVQGIVNVAVVKKYLLVAATSQNTDEMALFVTDDTIKWHRAIFPTDHKINQEAYTVLESTNYSIQIDVLTTHPGNPMGVLFTSNSNGTFFTRNVEHTNRNHHGHVDFEKISGIQGIFLVNKVSNGDAVESNHRERKTLVTEITFDDGRSFEPIKVGEETLHLHSVTEISNVGRVYSSPAPGLVLGNGNTGDHLGSYWDSSLFISDTAGATWIKGPQGPHKYEFGDQGSILLAIRDVDETEGKSTSEITYSLNHGKDWATAALPDDLKVKPFILTTTQDSTSLKFILVAGVMEGDAVKQYYVISIDFDGMHESTCKAEDMEEWFARVDANGKATCLMGHTQRFNRRKKDAKCFLKQDFKEPVVETTNCDCTDRDFECDYNFRKEPGDQCVAAGPIAAPEGSCRDAKEDDTFMGSSGWRLIPGNTCVRVAGKQMDDKVERKCKESTAPPVSAPSGKIGSTQHQFDGEWTGFLKHYLEKGDSSSDADETIIARPYNMVSSKLGNIALTRDHGKTWEYPEALKRKPIWAIMTHTYFKEMAFFIQENGEVIYTVDRGSHWHDFKARIPVETKDFAPLPLVFHPDKKDWLLWLGRKCDPDGGGECYLEAQLSTDRGDRWETIARYVKRCEFTGSSSYNWRPAEQILCVVQEREGSERDIPLQLIASDDLQTSKIVQSNVKDFATMAEFIVVAQELPDRQTLQAFASLDGEQYTEVEFPHNFEVTRQHAYTVLDSSTHAVNLFVPTVMEENHKYGTIIKSNSNGTSYVVSISGVNCDEKFFVDFEKMLGLEGVILVNTVANRDKPQEPKKKQTRISHNDGAEWSFLPPPAVDAAGNSYPCSSSSGDASCALHIHGYTERLDHRKTYSSAGAVGLMFGIGNVGPVLGDDMKDADTFMTTDAGISWRSVKKGPWTWAYGDQGSIIVLVPRARTSMVSYTTDEGATWVDYTFVEGGDVEVLDISTVGSGSSRNFLLWCKRGDRSLFTVNLDFSGLTAKACEKYEDAKGDANDYYIWSPKHPMQSDNCLFGHVSQYLRKRTDRQCYNGYKIQHLYGTTPCECKREDFECDFNYELSDDRTCTLVPGLQAISKEEWCAAHPDEIEFHERSGYRRIPLSTCQGGRDMANYTDSSPCKNHEDEYARRHRGPGGFVIFLAVFASVGGAGAVGWWVWRAYQAGSFGGQIRLGEQPGLPSAGDFFDTDRPWVRVPVVAVSAVVAVVGAIPLVVGALWRAGASAAERWGIRRGGSRGAYSGLSLNGGGGVGSGGPRRFTTRDSFARGADGYAGVDEDEGELLGDDESDEEV